MPVVVVLLLLVVQMLPQLAVVFFFALLDGATGYVCGVNRQEFRCILCCVAPSKSTWLSGARPSRGGLGQDWRRVTAQNGNNFERSCPHKKQNM